MSKNLTDVIAVWLVVLPWLAGIALAKGWWMTTFTILFFPYAWYVTVEHALHLLGII